MDFFVLNELKKFNKIIFDPAEHKYTVNDKVMKSVTGVVGLVHTFDSNLHAARVAASMNIPVRDVLLSWERKGEYAKTKGHEMHSYIENLWQGKRHEFKSSSKFIDMFVELDVLKEQYLNFYNPAKKILKLIAAENIVYDEELGVAGTFDGLFHNLVNKSIDIWDWKTSASINKTSTNKMKILDHLDDCNFNEYALQLSLYRYIIERNTDIKIKFLNICQISTKNKNYNAFRVPYLKDEVIELLKHIK